tara:strand:- start:409 stop:606 length:198 start_codon:yes stop_codon:yes gene_type:complete
MNAGIISAIIGKHEKEAVKMLNQFKCQWRVCMRDGSTVPDLTPDRNDKRYNLVLKDNHVERVFYG